MPWFVYTFDASEGEMAITFLSVSGLSESQGRPAGEIESILLGKHTLSLTVGKETEPHVLAVDMEGRLHFVPESDLQPVYYAHLGRFDPVKQAMRLLEFVTGQ